MRVGVLTTSFPRDPNDGAGSFVLGFARALIARGCRVDVLAPEPAEPVASLAEPRLDVTHVRYLWPRSLQRTFYGAGVPDNLRRDPRAWLGPLPFTVALAAAARTASGHWDALVSHWAIPCGLVAAGVRGTRPHLAVLHSADVHALMRLPARRALARCIARGSSGLWFVTSAHRERFLGLLDGSERTLAHARSWVSPMGIDLPRIEREERERARRELGVDRFSVLALGRLVAVKGVDVLLRASRNRDFCLLIAGDGPERARLEAEARTFGVDARFFGHVAGGEKRSLLMAADAFVVPSRVLPGGRSEGVPVAMLEAMAHGLPIVASAVGGISDVIASDPRAGVLVPPDEPERLGDALERLRRERSWTNTARDHARRIAEQHCWSRAIEPALTVLSAQHRHRDFAPTP